MAIRSLQPAENEYGNDNDIITVAYVVLYNIAPTNQLTSNR